MQEYLLHNAHKREHKMGRVREFLVEMVSDLKSKQDGYTSNLKSMGPYTLEK